MAAAIFVDARGPYVSLLGVDACWTVERDARLYTGPDPVVAHPPCERWGRYWGGGPSAKTPRVLGDDAGCFASALASVRRFGGVLEHPEGSHAFRHFGLTLPRWRQGWVEAPGGFVCCVAQGNYGHRARKLTWLYTTASRDALPELDWSIPNPRPRLDAGYHSADERRARHAVVGALRNAARLSTRENLLTPEPFARILVEIARSARAA